MKKPVKVVLGILGGVVALLLLLILANPLWLGPVVKTVVTTVVPGVVKCDVDLAACSINLYTGKIRLEGFALKNPQGYDEPNAVSFESLNIELIMSTLFSQKIVIHDITLEKPFVSYVFDEAGTNNFARILAPLQAAKTTEAGEKQKPEAPKTEAAEAPKAEKAAGPKVVIDRLAINGTKVKYRKVTIPVPVPTLTKIGYGKETDEKTAAEPKGATLAEARDVVWDSMKDKITSVSGVADAAVSGATEAVSNVAGAASEAATKASEAVTGVTGAAAEAATKATEAAADAVKDGAKAVGDGLKKLNPFGK